MPQAKEKLESKATSEYVAGGSAYYGNRLWNGTADSFQPHISGENIERARRDDEISSSVEFLIDSMFADGGQVLAAVPVDDPEFEQAEEIADFCSKAIAAASKNFLFTLRQQFRAAFYHGLKVGEIVLRYENNSRFDNKLVLDRVNLKPLNATAFLTDEFDNVLGLIAAQKVRQESVITPENLDEDEVIELEKFLILSFEHDDNDPRGLTQIKAAYESFADKCLTRVQYKDWRKKNTATQKFFTTPEKSPDIIQINPQTGEPLTYPNGKPIIKTAQKALMEAAGEMENHSVLVAPYGTTCTQLEVFGNGEQFEKSFKLNNNATRKSILGDALATGAADKDARAARQSSMNVVDLRVKSFKTITCLHVKTGVLTLLTRANYPENLWHLVPDYFLGDTERRDWATDVSAATSGGYKFAKKHYPELDKQFGLDPRDEDDETMQEGLNQDEEKTDQLTNKEENLNDGDNQ